MVSRMILSAFDWLVSALTTSLTRFCMRPNRPPLSRAARRRIASEGATIRIDKQGSRVRRLVKEWPGEACTTAGRAWLTHPEPASSTCPKPPCSQLLPLLLACRQLAPMDRKGTINRRENQRQPSHFEHLQSKRRVEKSMLWGRGGGGGESGRERDGDVEHRRGQKMSRV
jgi:hypothetical protein